MIGGENVRIEAMTMADLDGALAVEQACFRDAWSREVYHATLLLPYVRYFAAKDGDGQVVGTLGLRLIAGEGEITNVAVLPRWRGLGIAGRMMEAALREGGENGLEAYTLEVRASNRAAIAVYERYGFRTEGIRRDFYTEPREDALIMWLRKGKTVQL